MQIPLIEMDVPLFQFRHISILNKQKLRRYLRCIEIRSGLQRGRAMEGWAAKREREKQRNMKKRFTRFIFYFVRMNRTSTEKRNTQSIETRTTAVDGSLVHFIVIVFNERQEHEFHMSNKNQKL